MPFSQVEHRERGPVGPVTLAKQEHARRPTSLQVSPDTLIIGLGNEYRGDDGIGLFLAHKLKEKNLPDTIIEIYRGEGTGLMALWKQYSSVFLLDALCAGSTPGKIYRFDVNLHSLPPSIFNPSTHTFNVAETVRLAKALNLLPAHLIIYGIEGKDFKMGDGISSVVKAAARQVIERVLEDINDIRTGYNPLQGPPFAQP